MKLLILPASDPNAAVLTLKMLTGRKFRGGKYPSRDTVPLKAKICRCETSSTGRFLLHFLGRLTKKIVNKNIAGKLE